MSLAAIAMQIVVIISFAVLAGTFQLRFRAADIHSKAVSVTLRTLYISMGLILVRCLYRLVEHLGNTKIDLEDPTALAGLSPALRYEAFSYIFEASLMLINLLIWNFWNPGRGFKRNVYLGGDGVTEIEYEEERRPWWLRWIPRSSQTKDCRLQNSTICENAAPQPEMAK